MTIEDLYDSVYQFRKRIDKILSKHESSSSRIISLKDSFNRVNRLTLRQEDLFNESIRCIERELYRSAHVSAWAAFIDFVADKLGEDGYIKINSIKNWKLNNADDLRDKVADYLILGCLEEIGLINKPELRSLRGLLAKRNECGHPSNYKPGLNETLGYTTELLSRIDLLQQKKIV